MRKILAVLVAVVATLILTVGPAAACGGGHHHHNPPPPTDACSNLPGNQPSGTQCTQPQGNTQEKQTYELNCKIPYLKTTTWNRSQEYTFDQTTNTWVLGPWSAWKITDTYVQWKEGLPKGACPTPKPCPCKCKHKPAVVHTTGTIHWLSHTLCKASHGRLNVRAGKGVEFRVDNRGPWRQGYWMYTGLKVGTHHLDVKAAKNYKLRAGIHKVNAFHTVSRAHANSCPCGGHS